MPQPNIPHPKLRGEWAELRFMESATARGFRVNKPWGETSPYDVATDHLGLFRRVQVKCTPYKRHHSAACPEQETVFQTVSIVRNGSEMRG